MRDKYFYLAVVLVLFGIFELFMSWLQPNIHLALGLLCVVGARFSWQDHRETVETEELI